MINDDPALLSVRYFAFGTAISRAATETFELGSLIRSAFEESDSPRAKYLREASLSFNRNAESLSPPLQPIRAGDLMALDTLQDILRYVADDYCVRQHPGTLTRARDWVRGVRPSAFMERAATAFVASFPPGDGTLAEDSADTFLAEDCEDQPVPDIVAREEILLRLASTNPAAQPLVHLYDDAGLVKEVHYDNVVSTLEEYFETQPAYDELGMTLFRCLRAPIEACPDSLEGQLAYIRSHWDRFLPADMVARLDVVTGIMTEEALERGMGDAPMIPLRFGLNAPDGDLYPEYERFSPDADWMSNVVLIAKLAYVWLDQLSKKYERAITRLDEIPDEELDQLARWGFNGLWLIGVWERSCASEDIKKRMGNPDAAASAYSLYDYTIAEDLGGMPALERFKERARRRGIRLASDMVPNHVGIFSRWVVEHPDWFLQSDSPPFPGYQFNGPDLSPDDRVGVYIEDGYWEKRDAAVVFKRVDHHTGDVRYIYHGNDGTHMPWNDTAQLNYLLPDVREAVTQTILHVASLFPIIRFDAAMTLTKKHYQRLWFPMPGDAGAIPSRAESSMSKQEFDSLMPLEFWREVVDRAATEAPDTLLLAEAFWLMEGYFVRTLGMHRVYNSAFMNMIKMEENDKYRETIKNVLSFSPEILKRFVNFMNNPDERTAVEQFGKGDKYFGSAVLMATLPGLPMFGHGQIEGFEEKYGMEFRRAYQDEHVDDELVQRHERELFPLLKKRYLFSGVSNFALYDFYTGRDRVNENVLAYSNQAGDERSLVLYNNAYDSTSGWIRIALPMKGASDETTRQPSLAEALNLNADPDVFYVLLDHLSGLSYLRSGKDLAEKGLFVELSGYGYHVFLGFREVRNSDGGWAKLAKHLNGAGVDDIDEANASLAVAAQINAFQGAMNTASVGRLAQIATETGRRVRAMQWHLNRGLKRFWASVHPHAPLARSTAELANELSAWRSAFRRAAKIGKAMEGDSAKSMRAGLGLEDSENGVSVSAAWLMLRVLQEGFDGEPGEWIHRWRLVSSIADVFRDQEDAADHAALAQALLRFTTTIDDANMSVARWFDDHDVRLFTQYHEYQGVHYVNKERLALWMRSVAAASVVCALRQADNKTSSTFEESILDRFKWIADLLATAEDVLFQIEEFLAIAKRMPEAPPLLVAAPKEPADATAANQPARAARAAKSRNDSTT